MGGLPLGARRGESVTVCWHVAPGEDWSEHWRDYLVEWVAVTPITLLMPSTEMERCEQSGEPRQIIRWRLWRAGIPGFVEHFLARDLSWETITRQTRNEGHASTLRELISQPGRGKGGNISPTVVRRQKTFTYESTFRAALSAACSEAFRKNGRQADPTIDQALTAWALMRIAPESLPPGRRTLERKVREFYDGWPNWLAIWRNNGGIMAE